MIAISRCFLPDGSLQPWRDRVRELAGEPGVAAHDRRVAEGQEPEEAAGRAVREVLGDRAAIAASIIADVEQLLGDGDELLVIRRVIDRLQLGRRSYGPLNVDDGRDFQLERALELADGDLYGVFELVRRERARGVPAPDDSPRGDDGDADSAFGHLAEEPSEP